MWLVQSSLSRPVLHHGPWSRTMEDRLFPWSNFMIHLPCSDFFKKSIYRVFGSLIRCESNVDHKEWPCTKSECAEFILIYVQKGRFWKEKKIQVCCLLLSSSTRPQKTFHYTNDYDIISLSWALVFFYWNTSLTSLTTKSVGSCQWIM